MVDRKFTEDPDFTPGLIEETGEFFKRRRQLTRSLVMQFLNEQVFNKEFDLSEDPMESAEKVGQLYPTWKGLLIRLEDQDMNEEKKARLRTLTLEDVAAVSTELFQYYSNKLTILDVENTADTWSKVAKITRKAAELSQKEEGNTGS
ncbi:MAG: hypothetical protein Q8P92_04855 [Candidatus Daviesbacteria bacterium]|nr:hypothetical protein [Candidatus Daviesbacteria bacterium]